MALSPAAVRSAFTGAIVGFSGTVEELEALVTVLKVVWVRKLRLAVLIAS